MRRNNNMDERLRIFFLLTFIVSKTYELRFLTHIQNQEILPVVGEDITLACTFTLRGTYREITWSDKYNNILVTCKGVGCRNELIVPDMSKYSFMADSSSGNLTIRDLIVDDSGLYRCKVFEYPDDIYVTNALLLNVLLSAMPRLIAITDDRSEDGYNNGELVSITSGQTHNLTCSVQNARPPAELEWHIPEEVQILLDDQYNAVYWHAGGPAYISKRIVSVTPSRDDDGKIFRCVASHRELDNKLQLSARLDVQVPPGGLRLTSNGSIATNVTETRSVIVFEDSATSFTCKSVGSRPTALISWIIGSDDELGSTTSTSTTNEADQGLRDTNSTLQLIPKRRHHNQLLRCVAYAGINQRQTEVRVIVYGTPDPPYLNGTDRLQDGVSSNVTCTSNNGYPAPNFQWYLGSKNITTYFNTQSLRKRNHRLDSISVFNFTPSIDDHGELLVCQVCQPNTASMMSWSVSVVLHVFFIPDPPFRFFVDRNQTTPSSVFVAWQPGFDGGLQQTFNLEFCPNDTQVEKEGCGVVKNLTGTSYTLVGLNPFTWYWLSLVAVNSAGGSSPVETGASTTPLQPESYGVTTSWDKQKQILTLSEANQTLDEICFITLRTYDGPDCASMNETECIEPGTEVSIYLEDDIVLVTFGRGLCSKPADLTNSPGPTETSTERSLFFMTIAIGVMASAGFILLISVGFISLGLMYFYGVLCCVKQKKDDENNTQPEGQVEDQGDYADIAQVPPLHASESTTSYYMDLEPVPLTNNDTTIGSYMDLKPIPRADNDTTTSYMDYDDCVSPSLTRNEFEADFVNTEMTDGNALQNDPDNQDPVNPSFTRNCSGAVYVNTDEKASKNESGDPEYINTLPTAQEDDDKTTITYMEMKPIPPMSSL